MKFGVREICDVVLRAKTAMKVGGKQFYKNEPVLYFDTLTTSSLEGAATTVYAQGGKGNTRLMAWEGERTLTFNMTDALISPESFSVLSGADIYDASETAMYVHTTARAVVDSSVHSVKVPGIVCWYDKASMKDVGTGSSVPTDSSTPKPIGNDFYNAGADIFIMSLKNGEVASEPMIPDEAIYDASTPSYSINYSIDTEGNYFSTIICSGMVTGSTVLVDYYVKQNKGKQIEITPDKFGGYFYLEASTLFRDEATGQDLPAEFIIPNCKIQSNFTFTMAATGDPSTFDFVLDAFPDYTKFDQTKKVLAIVQVIEDVAEAEAEPQRAHIDPEDAATADDIAFDHRSSYTYGSAYTTDLYAEHEDIVATEDRRKAST